MAARTSEPSIEDQKQKQAIDRGVECMIEWLEGTLNLGAPIRSLTRTNLESLAYAAVRGWIDVRTEQAAAEVTEPDYYSMTDAG